MSKHKHHDMIIAWAADITRKVEVLCNGGWFEVDPAWHPEEEYRFADSVLKYRVALFDNGFKRWTCAMSNLSSSSSSNLPEAMEALPYFVKWLTDWVEVDGPVAEKPEPKTKKFERWLNLYPDGTCQMHRAKETADELAETSRVECRRIEWEAP